MPVHGLGETLDGAGEADDAEASLGLRIAGHRQHRELSIAGLQATVIEMGGRSLRRRPRERRRCEKAGKHEDGEGQEATHVESPFVGSSTL